MSQPETEAGWLHGRQIAFTGRLASMTRAEAATLIGAYRGEFVAAVTRQTAFLVIGQEGWPLRADGGLSHKLHQARSLQRRGFPIAILSEEVWLERLGLETRAEVHRRYTTAQLCRLLRLPRDRIRGWMRAGLVQPVETVHGVCYFDFQQVTSVKTLCELTGAGVTPEHIRRSLEQLSGWLGDVEQPLAQLALLERDGQLLVRLKEGQLAEPTGQLQFDFAHEAAGPSADAPTILARGGNESAGARTAEEWWDRGCDAEEAGRWREAADAYRQVLLLRGPDAEACFNLANVLYALGEKPRAAERYRQAVEINHQFVEAWNNLGNVLAELDELDEGLAAYRQALALNPHYADAHYNLADTLEQAGRPAEARPHWQAYLALESNGPWADYARQRRYASP